MTSEGEEIRNLVRELAAGLNGDVLAVGILGSIARGDFHERSDIDILVVTRQPFSLKEQDRFYELFSQALIPRFGRDVTVLVYDLGSLKRVPTWHTLVMMGEALLVEDRADIADLFRRILQEAEAHGIIYDPERKVFRTTRPGRVVFGTGVGR
ncbi:MAG: nucleotidyltransferase family protein [Anaerolineae bacterium]